MEYKSCLASPVNETLEITGSVWPFGTVLGVFSNGKDNFMLIENAFGAEIRSIIIDKYNEHDNNYEKIYVSNSIYEIKQEYLDMIYLQYKKNKNLSFMNGIVELDISKSLSQFGDLVYFVDGKVFEYLKQLKLNDNDIKSLKDLIKIYPYNMSKTNNF